MQITAWSLTLLGPRGIFPSYVLVLNRCKSTRLLHYFPITTYSVICMPASSGVCWLGSKTRSSEATNAVPSQGGDCTTRSPRPPWFTPNSEPSISPVHLRGRYSTIRIRWRGKATCSADLLMGDEWHGHPIIDSTLVMSSECAKSKYRLLLYTTATTPRSPWLRSERHRYPTPPNSYFALAQCPPLLDNASHTISPAPGNARMDLY